MNRHLINYAALPSEALGSPIRQEPTKGSPETPWTPLAGAHGVREVSHKDHVPPVSGWDVVAVIKLAEEAIRPFGGRLISINDVPVQKDNLDIEFAKAIMLAGAPKTRREIEWSEWQTFVVGNPYL